MSMFVGGIAERR